MSTTAFNTTISSCGNSLYSINLTDISPGVRAVLIVRIVVNALTCPLIILLNMLVMVAVKTKPQLRTKSNIALACLSTTDLIVGLAIQPLHITATSLFLKGERMFCTQYNRHIKNYHIYMYTGFTSSFGFDERRTLRCD